MKIQLLSQISLLSFYTPMRLIQQQPPLHTIAGVHQQKQEKPLYYQAEYRGA